MIRYIDVRTNPEYQFDSVLTDINYNFGYLTAVTSSITTNFLSLSGGTVTGNTTFSSEVYINVLSATTISGGTYYSGSTPLETVITNIANALELNDITRVQPGLNTYTGGTTNAPTINISAATLSYLSAVSISADTIIGPSFETYSNTANISGNTNLILSGNQSILIDVTNPRQITSGVLRINHNAGTDNTKSIFINTNTGGYGSTSSVFFNYIASGLTSAQNAQSIFIQLDKDASTGGVFDGVRFANLTNAGAITYNAISVGPEINPISQQVSSSAFSESYLYYSASTSGYSNIASACTGNSINITLFNEDNDILYIGHSSIFLIINFILNTVASNPGIKPEFQYSLGGGLWQTFSPSDGTNGMRLNGSISWNTSTVSGWNTDTVNSVSGKYWIKITRTTNNLTTVPTEQSITINTGVINYKWDYNGNVNLNSLSANTLYSGNTLLDSVISNYVNQGRFLPLSGGTVTGNTTISATLNLSFLRAYQGTGATNWLEGKLRLGQAGTPNATLDVIGDIRSDILSATTISASTATISELSGSSISAITFVSKVFTGNSNSAQTIDWSSASNFYYTLTANTTFSFSNSKEGQTIQVAVSNSGSTGLTSSWPTSASTPGLYWQYGVTPGQTTGMTATDIYTFARMNNKIFGVYSQGFKI